jgi:hypothetical protein
MNKVISSPEAHPIEPVGLGRCRLRHDKATKPFFVDIPAVP